MAHTNPNPDEIDLDDSGSDIHANANANPNPSSNDNTNEDDLTAEEAALAATLGFTAFGAQHQPDDTADDSSRPLKKRRFNPHANDAIIAAPDHTSSSSSTLPTHLTAHRVQLPPPSTDEIINYDDSDAGPSRDGTPTPYLNPTPYSNPNPYPNPYPTHGSYGSARGGRGGASRGGGSGASGGHGFNPTWYIDYYDASSNANPWETLERKRGLAVVGSWLARGAGGASTSASHGVSAGADAGAGAGADVGADTGAGGESVTTATATVAAAS